jgi:glyoxylase-like metal-dependent hydrolase (beta-lactamase superfamily II)
VPDPRARLVLAPNPGFMTLEGTNTYVLAAPGARSAVVVDAGPPDQGHLDAVLAEAERGGQRIALILLTHGHPDHSGGAPMLAEQARVPVRALDPAHRLGDEGLDEGDVIELEGLEIRVLATPGHSADSLSFVLPAGTGADGDQAEAVLTGDTILGRGTTVVAHPDGRLDDYLQSLKRLRELGGATVLPGHGPELPSAGAAAEYYLAHREQRLEQVRAALAAGDTTPMQVVERVYADVDRVLWPAAELSVRAQLDYLRGA